MMLIVKKKWLQFRGLAGCKLETLAACWFAGCSIFWEVINGRYC